MPDSVVEIVYQDGIWRFTPRVAEAARTVFIFFPGALVDPRAYAPLARSVAKAGYPVVVVELPRRGAFGGADSRELATRIGSVVSTIGAERQIVVGGHSRGSVVATRMAAENRAALAGLVIIGSSHPRDVDLSSLEIPVTKIVGTRDGLASPDEVRENAGLLPRQTRWIWIEGGNHSQFGWYGFQPLDRRPRIEASKQRAVMLKGVLEVMDAVNRRAVDRHIMALITGFSRFLVRT